MGVRVPIRISCGIRSVVTSALVNSGFESPEPDLATPTQVAKQLGLWPPSDFKLETLLTAGGEIVAYRVEGKCKVELLDETTSRVLAVTNCNIIVDEHLDEVLLSDYLIDELGIIVVSFRRGLWRHVGDKVEIVRYSVNKHTPT